MFKNFFLEHSDENSYFDVDEHGVLNVNKQYITTNNITNIVIPNEVMSKAINKKRAVTKLDDYCFSSCDSIVSIILPKSLTDIGKWAFYNCTSLQSVTFTGYGVNVIPRGCFASCIYMKNIILPESIIELKDHCFAYSGLETFKMPDRIKRVPDRAFIRCKNLRSIELHDNVSSIGDGAFYECKSLTSIKLPKALIELKSACFGWCYNIEEYMLPSKLKRLGDWCFIGNKQLKEMIIPENVKTMGPHTFDACTSLEVIKLALPKNGLDNAPWGADPFDVKIEWNGIEVDNDEDTMSEMS